MTNRESRAAKDKPKDVLDDANDFNGDEIYDVLSKAEGNVTDESRARRRVNKQSAGYNGGGAGYIEEDDGGYGYGGKKGKNLIFHLSPDFHSHRSLTVTLNTPNPLFIFRFLFLSRTSWQREKLVKMLTESLTSQLVTQPVSHLLRSVPIRRHCRSFNCMSHS